ncbi:MAG: BTAD domain-containing putative transcriptional regulator [Chloroflexota bacterium]
MAAKLKITLSGGFQIETNEQTVDGFRSDSSRGLLVYLAMLPPGPQRRSLLATFLWPEATEKQARSNLRQTLLRLRKALDSAAPTLSDELLITSHKTITLKSELVWCDVVVLQTLITAVAEHQHSDLYTCPSCWERLQQAAKLYQGEFLRGFYLSGSPSFNDWQDDLREKQHVQALQALDTLLVMAQQRGELALVQQFAQQQLTLEPWRESGQRHLIWALGQQGETEAAIRQYEQFKALLRDEFGTQPAAETTTLYRQLRTTTALDLPNPYQGLQTFTEANAAFFYGRERYITRLQTMLQEQDFVAVIGSSGSGKSSLVQGGLLPRLRAQTTTQPWMVVQCRPGKRPFHNLISALKPLFPAREQDQLAGLRTGKVSLTQLAKKAGGTTNRLLIYIDQFEELFTLVPHKETRDRFIALLLEAQNSSLNISTLLTMRADFMAEALAYPTLAEMTQRGLLLLGGMTNEEMEEAITLPAQKLNVTFEPGLVARLLHDVGREPGQLPLLQFALTELWEQRNHGQLTHTTYDAIGGLSGALANYADAVYQELPQPDQTEIRRLFFRLVRPGEQAADTRQVVSSDRLSDHQWQLVQRLANTRLLVTDQEPSGNYTVELVHEALIQYWERLQDWLTADKTFRIWNYRLQTAIGHWEALDEDEGVLLRGSQLVEAENWFAERAADMDRRTKRFITASLALRTQQEVVAAKQRKRERAFTLTLQAQLALQEGDANKAREFALAANQMDDPPASTQPLLAEAAYIPGVRWHTPAHEEAVLALTTSPDRQTFLSAGADGAVQWHAVATGEQLSRFTAHQTAVSAIAFSPDGETAVSGDAEGELIWWHIASGNICQQFAAHQGNITAAAILPDGERVLTAGADHVLRLWELASGQLLQTFAEHQAAVTCFDVSQNGRFVLSGGTDQQLLLWDIATGNLLRTLGSASEYAAHQMIKSGHFGTVSAVALHPNNQTALSVGMDRAIILWNLETGSIINYTQYDFPLLDVAINENGAYALISSIGTQICLYNLYTYQIVRRLQEAQRVQVIRFVGPTMALSGSSTGNISLWRLRSGAEERFWRVMRDDALLGFCLTQDRQMAMGGFKSGAVEIWDVASGETVRRWQAHDDALIRHPRFSGDGRFLVTGCGNFYRPSKETTVRVWDVATAKQVLCHALHTNHVWATAFSPNGRYVLSSALDGLICYSSLDDGASHVLLNLEQQLALTVHISPDSRFAALGLSKKNRKTTDPSIFIVEVATGKVVKRLYGHKEAVDAIHFGPNGRYLLSAGHDNKLLLWDLTTDTIVHELLGHRGAATALDFHPTKPFAVSAAAENQIIIWDLRDGTELRRLEGHDDLIAGIGFTPDGKHVISGSLDNTVRIWRFDETAEHVLHWLDKNREPEIRDGA